MSHRDHGAAVRASAMRLLARGTTYRETAEITGVAERTLKRWAKAAGVTPRRAHRLRASEVVALAKRFGQHGAAEVLGCSRGAVSYHVHRAREAAHG